MEIKQELVDFFTAIASFADRLQRRLAWFLGICLVASLGLAWHAYSAVSPLWWNVVKCGLLLLPILVWAGIWLMLSQLQEVPELAANFAARDDYALNNISPDAVANKTGLLTLFSTIREIRNNESLAAIAESIGSVTLLANPIFAIFAFLMLVILFLLVIIAPFLLLF